MEASGELFSYLMDCQQYLRNQDLDGWMKTFQPKVVVKVVEKKARRCPSTAVPTPLPNCRSCQGEFVIEDTTAGQYVCVMCGLIQSRVVSMDAAVYCSMDRLKNGQRVYIHRYSKIAYFWTVTRFLQGESTPNITKETLSRLQAEIDGTVTIEKINKALRKLNISRKYRRHRWSLLRTLGGGRCYEWPADVVLYMLKRFRRIEYYWKYFKSELFENRSTFFSYPGLIYEFLKELGMDAPESLLLKSKVLRSKQRRAFKLLDDRIFIEEQLIHNKKLI